MAIKSKIVSWLGVLLSIMTELYKRVAKMGGSDEHFHFLATPDAEALLDQIAKLIRWGSEEFGKLAFRVEVDYGVTLQELLSKPVLGRVGESLRHLRWEPRPGKQTEVTVVLFPLDGFETGSSAAADASVRMELRHRGYRSANLAEIASLTNRRDVLQKLGNPSIVTIFSLAEGLRSSRNEDDAILYPALVLNGDEEASLLPQDVDVTVLSWIAAIPDRK